VPWDGVGGVKEFKFSVDDQKRTGKIFVTNVYGEKRSAKGHINLKYFNEFEAKELESFGKVDFIFNSEIFKKMLDGVLYAVDPNERREFIQGINVLLEKDHMFFVGSNGRMLSEYRIENVSKIKNKSYTVKYDFMSGLKRLLKEETQIFFNVDDNTRTVKTNFDNVHFYGKIIIGHEYPKYKPTLDNFKDVVVVDKAELLESLLPFMELLNPEDNNRLTFSIAKNNIIISSDEASFSCDLNVEYNKNFIVDVNGRYLAHTLEAIKDDVVKIKFSDDKGCLLLDSGSSDTHRTLITPIKRKLNV
jgi:DNA polymerase III sliding clamp (beta) subunit (PCNA family)